MPTTTTRTSSATRAPINIKAALKAGERAPTKRTDRASASKDAVYIQALKDAGGFHKKAFFVELAVCLAFYAEHEKSDKKTKAQLRPIYERAGYDCKNGKDEDYKTVQRRISVAADLFMHLGAAETIHDWMEGATGAKGLERIVERLEKAKLDSIQAVQKAVGKTQPARKTPAKATQTVQAGQTQGEQGQGSTSPATTPQEPSSEPNEADKAVMASVGANIDQRQAAGGQPAKTTFGRRAIDNLPPERVIRTEHVVLAIPLDATKNELMKLAQEVMLFAAHLTEVPATVAH